MGTLISIHQATVKALDKVAFEKLNFYWSSGQHWAILGESGADQQLFLDLIGGKALLVKGDVIRPFAEAYQLEMSTKGEVNSFRDLISEVSQRYVFKNKSNLQNFYFQQRFNSLESDDALTVGEYLDELDKRPGTWTVAGVIELLKLDDLVDKSLIKLSNGETRRLAIAGALLKNPALLLMHQPLTGLDRQTRETFDLILQDIINSGIHVMISTQPQEIPSSITHVAQITNGQLNLKNKHQVDLATSSEANSTDLNHSLFKSLLEKFPVPSFETLVIIQNATIRYGDKALLDQVNWTVRKGEYWALKGHNGAGKSTLLSLILGEHPQAYANDIWLFDRKRGTGESIWDIKKNIGFVAPELPRFFPANQTCFKVVLSGLFDTMGLFKKVTSAQENLAWDWLKLFVLEDLANQLIQRVTPEQQRFVLLARALIKNPALLVLDEAAQGLDVASRKKFRATIDEVCKFLPCGLIYVSHYEQDIPTCVNQTLLLNNGKVEQFEL
jgi:molybdate transport system ATP-binding protein